MQPILKRINMVHGSLSPETAEVYSQMHPYACFTARGDCMEAVEIYDGDFVEVDFTVKPLPKKHTLGRDIVLIWRDNQLMVKEYIGAWGKMQIVGTRYRNPRFDGSWKMNQCLTADYIFGVVTACYDNGLNLRWEKELKDYPSELSYKQMIKGANIGVPIGATGMQSWEGSNEPNNH